MDADERLEALEELLNQAGDLAENIAEAFKAELGNDSRAVAQAGRALIQVARRIR